ncbi:cytochrome c biogenesis protein CcmG/thiol:disulfide interchange protein DsbE [Sphingomonas sp. BE138]|uniref:DsbE family thiol:disulfide interchange protein n=1 Tax=Sphingomonas sp. BE138 TaxID=2817845 RepID=UPI00285C478F|nr:DsbE family thiol:disulfide interchange protein [Sphingomonas sp. BE138]MDR6788048.1 cytochrome c biogenesis protein CcmG/thiol:disulfide interchange protein DsbE [Sphingomonas sp. BE138]
MKRWLVWLPLCAFGVVVAVIAWGLWRPADRTVRSALVGRALPEFVLPAIAPGKPGLATADFRQGSPRLLNVFASWCVPCVAEAPQLLTLKAAGVPIDAIAIKDTPGDIAAFLRRNGDPYARIGADAHSRVQLALGSSGVPETFVIDGKGVIRAQHVGDIRAEDVPALLQALANAK